MVRSISNILYKCIIPAILCLLLARTSALSQTDTLNVSWNVNPPTDTIQYYLLYRVFCNNLSDTAQQGNIIDTIYENSGTVVGTRVYYTDLDRSHINPGALISYRTRAVNLHGISVISAHAHAGIPAVNWTDMNIDSGRTTAFPFNSFLIDRDNDPFQLTLLTAQPSHISLQIQNNQLLVTPDPITYTGPASFELTVFDPDSFWDRTLVTLTIDTGLTQNNRPVAVNDTTNTTIETPVTINVLSNDYDPDSDPLIVSAIIQDPGNGQVVIDQSTSIIYTPQQGFLGNDIFQYEIQDGRGGMDTASVHITVSSQPNRRPIARDDSVTIFQAVPVTIDVLENDDDPDGDQLSISNIITSPQYGLAVINQGRDITYSPGFSFVNSDQFRYEIFDGREGRDTALVRIILLGTESIPEEVIAFPNPYRLSSGHDRMIIEPLPTDAKEIIIVSTAGELVYEATLDPTQSRRWEWDVKNQDIASGLYIYVIKGRSGDKIASGKIAIIR